MVPSFTIMNRLWSVNLQKTYSISKLLVGGASRLSTDRLCIDRRKSALVGSAELLNVAGYVASHEVSANVWEGATVDPRPSNVHGSTPGRVDDGTYID